MRAQEQLPNFAPGVTIHPMASFDGFPENVHLAEGVVVDAFARIHCHKTGYISVGRDTYLGPGSFLHTGKEGGKVILGSNCTVQAYSMVQGHGGCIIGNDVRIAPHTVITAANHVFTDTSRPIREQGLTKKGITIEDDVWIGASCMILDGVTIGKQSVLGAGSVVTKSLPPGSVAVGSALRMLGSRYSIVDEAITSKND